MSMFDLDYWSLYSLGEKYRQGLEVPQDDSKACVYYASIVYDERPDREQDDYYWRACYRLAVATYYGYGTEKDYDRAAFLLAKARALYQLRPKSAAQADIPKYDILYKDLEPDSGERASLKVTREMVLSSMRRTGLLTQYGSEEVATLYVVMTEDDVVRYDFESRTWSESSSDSYWDLWESEMMMTVMTGFEPEEAVELLEKGHAF